MIRIGRIPSPAGAREYADDRQLRIDHGFAPLLLGAIPFARRVFEVAGGGMTHWGWVPWILTGVTIVVTIYFNVVNRKPKGLQYDIVAAQALIEPNRYQQWTDLSVVFKDKPVEHPVLIVVRFRNTGKVEFREEDFGEPLGITAKNGLQIIAATIGVRSDDPPRWRFDLDEIQNIESGYMNIDRVSAPPLLLNPGEQLEFRVLAGGGLDGRFDVAGRVAGAPLQELGYQTRVDRIRERLRLTATWSVLAAILFASGWFYRTHIHPTEVVPELTGKPLPTASAMLHQHQLIVGDIEHAVSDIPGIRADNVIFTLPKAGAKLHKGDRVHLIVHVLRSSAPGQ